MIIIVIINFNFFMIINYSSFITDDGYDFAIYINYYVDDGHEG